MSYFMGDFLMELLSRFFLFLISLLVITHASRRVVQQEKDTSHQKLDTIQTLTWYHVIMFPIIGSIMLLILFYFFEHIQFIFSLFSICMSLVTIYGFLHPIIQDCTGSQQSHCGTRPDLCCHVISTDWNNFLACGIALLITSLWVITGHWLMLDILGVAIATFMIEFVRLPNLKLAAFFLSLLLLYDVFWVFLSSSIFKANVMVEVAIKKARNPVAVVANQFNMPEVAQAQPPLPLPGKLMIPSSYTEDDYSMLGLGDVILPGLLLCLAMRFDHLGQLSIGTKSIGATKYRLFCQKWSYFFVSLTGYGIGLLTAAAAVEISHYPQPALLYLVPGVLIPLMTKSLIQGHFRLLWHGPFNDAVDSTHPSNTTSIMPV